jgi:hypothetical protein
VSGTALRQPATNTAYAGIHMVQRSPDGKICLDLSKPGQDGTSIACGNDEKVKLDYRRSNEVWKPYTPHEPAFGSIAKLEVMGKALAQPGALDLPIGLKEIDLKDGKLSLKGQNGLEDVFVYKTEVAGVKTGSWIDRKAVEVEQVAKQEVKNTNHFFCEFAHWGNDTFHDPGAHDTCGFNMKDDAKAAFGPNSDEWKPEYKAAKRLQKPELAKMLAGKIHDTITGDTLTEDQLNAKYNKKELQDLELRRGLADVAQ